MFGKPVSLKVFIEPLETLIEGSPHVSYDLITDGVHVVVRLMANTNTGKVAKVGRAFTLRELRHTINIDAVIIYQLQIMANDLAAYVNDAH